MQAPERRRMKLAIAKRADFTLIQRKHPAPMGWLASTATMTVTGVEGLIAEESVEAELAAPTDENLAVRRFQSSRCPLRCNNSPSDD
mmetsp:Transcript_5640/g.12374  ORF Transcript_5640/g.12374 Transcript_5640/m.12374 type:complete len:87 (-) Transcript_5640:250-510(-)